MADGEKSQSETPTQYAGEDLAGGDLPSTDAESEVKPQASREDGVPAEAPMSFQKVRNQKDILFGRYKIQTDSPLDDSSPYRAHSFNVQDLEGEHTNLYCKVLDGGLPYRLKALQTLERVSNKHLQRVLAHGVLHLSTPNECRYVIILEKMPGKKLSELLSVTKSWSDRKLTHTLIQPIFNVLEVLAAHQVTVGQINTDTLYLDGETIMLEEFVSSPPGFNQSYFFETLDRLACDPLGKGEGDITIDFYALGIAVIHAALGLNPCHELDMEQYLHQRFALGTYNAIIGNRELSDTLDDFVRGSVNDTLRDRWSFPQAEVWLGGKRYNIIRPSPPKESSRAYVFGKDQFFSMRGLAYSLFKHWADAKAELRDIKLSRWVHLSAARPETADELKKVLTSMGGEYGRSPAEDDELVARSIIILDPTGPLRLREVSAHVDGLGTLLAWYQQQGRMDGIGLVTRTLEIDLPAFWAEHNPTQNGMETTNAIQKIDRSRNLFRNKSPGFGLERLMYELTPTLPCQSKMIRDMHVLSLEDALFALDYKANLLMKEADPYDKHIIAFIASKLELQGELKFRSLERLSGFKDSAMLSQLALLSRAQKRIGSPPLKGLTKWIGERTSKLVELYHNRNVRRELMDEFRSLSQQGQIEPLLKLITNADLIERDRSGFEKAQHKFRQNAEKMKELLHPKDMEKRASTLALRVSLLLSYAVGTMATLAALQDLELF